MYTVIGFPRTRAMRVMWMLEELGQDYTIVPAMPQSPEVHAFNPTGKVPVLVEGDMAVPDSVAIVTFLADRHGACTHPAGSPARALQDSFTQFCVDEVEGALWFAAKHGFVLPEERRVGAVKATCRWEFDRAMAALETRLGDGEFVTGDTFTVPDILFGHCANWAENGAKWPLPAGRVGAYLDRVRARPALARAMRRGAAAVPA